MYIQNFHIQQTSKANGAMAKKEAEVRDLDVWPDSQQGALNADCPSRETLLKQALFKSQYLRNLNTGGASAHSNRSKFLGDGPTISS